MAQNRLINRNAQQESHLIAWFFLNVLVVVVILIISGCASGRFQQVDTYMRQRNWQKARTTLEASVSNNPMDGEAHLLLARIYGELEQVEGMRASLGKAAAISPAFREQADFIGREFWIRYYSEGNDHFEEGTYNAAAQYFGLAVALEPENINGVKRYADALFLLGKFRQAGSLYENASEAEPANLALKNNLAEVFFLEENYKRAIELCNEILVARETEVNAMKRRAYAYDALGRFDAAVRDFETSAALDPSAQLLMDFGMLYFRAGAYTSAIEKLQDATAFTDGNLILYRYLGEANRRIHNYAEMAKWYRLIVDTFPEDLTGWKNLALAYEALGQKQHLAQARHHINKITSTN